MSRQRCCGKLKINLYWLKLLNGNIFNYVGWDWKNICLSFLNSGVDLGTNPLNIHIDRAQDIMITYEFLYAGFLDLLLLVLTLFRLWWFGRGSGLPTKF